MFGKLKEKLKNWASKISQEQESTEEKIVEEKIEKPKKKEEKIEKIKEEPKKEKKSFLKKLTDKKTIISEEKFEEYSEELEMLLLENNVALEISDKIIAELKQRLVEKELSKKEIELEIKNTLKEIIEEILIEPFDLIEKIKENKEPYVILFCGINGSGKTTAIAKLANKFQKQGISCVLSASDTFRAAAIDQIQKHGENLKIKVISQKYGADPTAVTFDAIQYAKKNHINCVLIDTAGRIHTAKNLMSEIEKINRVCKPNLKIFVGEATTGNDSVEQIKAFDEAISIDGIILSKTDVDEKGGTALSLGYITKKPILYIGTGQKYEDIEKFNKKKFIESLGL